MLRLLDCSVSSCSRYTFSPKAIASGLKALELTYMESGSTMLRLLDCSVSSCSRYTFSPKAIAFELKALELTNREYGRILLGLFECFILALAETKMYREVAVSSIKDRYK
jgi:hypothetical protein